MKKLLSVLALLFVGLVFMGLLPGTDASASEAKLNASKKKICVGASFNLSLDDVKGKVTWKSSDKSVAVLHLPGRAGVGGVRVVRPHAPLPAPHITHGGTQFPAESSHITC